MGCIPKWLSNMDLTSLTLENLYPIRCAAVVPLSAVGGRIKTSQLGSNQNQPLFSYKPFEDVLARG
jgi:hypothetical protein